MYRMHYRYHAEFDDHVSWSRYMGPMRESWWPNILRRWNDYPGDAGSVSGYIYPWRARVTWHE